MTPEQLWRAVAYHQISVLSPTRSKVAPGTEWVARDARGTLGFGSDAASAVENLLKIIDAPADTVGESEDMTFLD